MKTMFTTTLAAVTMLVAGSALAAGAYWHPISDGAVFAGPDGSTATVCYYDQDSTGTIVPQWICEEIDLYGADGPVLFVPDYQTPIKVSSVRWAYSFQDHDHGRDRCGENETRSTYREHNHGCSYRGGLGYYDDDYDLVLMAKD